ncbi:hypothetical protein AAFC00_006797 [Neodothiora populina]|uniref:Ran-binding-domain-containing protein n=1 Tax=Neodothiora populina TaxID=2781224 RepID=A0ABR3PB66_9PEZI
MDAILGKITSQAVNYAIRSGVALTSTYAIKQCSRLIKEAPRGSDREQLLALQVRLESKIRIISPAIDMIELIAARGNTSLESAVSLTKDIRWEIQGLGIRLSKAANEEELLRRRSKRAKSREQNELELKLIISDVRKLLDRIEDAVPLINLAITTSGVNLSTNLPATVSPSRLLQASTFLTSADSLYSNNPGEYVQVGPSYTLSIYMLFAGHASRPHDEESIRETTWKEVVHKAHVKLVRVPLKGLYHLPGEQTAGDEEKNSGVPESFPEDGTSLEFAYQLMMVEDLEDGRVHTFEKDEPQPGPFDDIAVAGIRDVVPIHQVSKIFYADTGKILNIGTEGEVNNPILLIKRDVHAEPPRRMMERRESVYSQRSDELEQSFADVQVHAESHSDAGDTADHSHNSDEEFDDQAELDAQIFRESAPVTPSDENPAVNEMPHAVDDSSAHWRLPADLDPEWIAFEVFTEEVDSDEEEESEESTTWARSSRRESLDPSISNAFANLNLRSSSPAAYAGTSINGSVRKHSMLAPSGPVKTSLSLLEMLIRLTALQQFRQASHLTIEDELLNFFLEDSATTGAGANVEYRQRIRRDARRRVGFDPYDESPIKRRGEEYLAHPRSTTDGWGEGAMEGSYREGSYREGSYFNDEGRYTTPDHIRQSVEYPRYESAGRSPSVRPSSPSPQLGRPPISSARSSPAAVRSSNSRQSMATPPSSTNKGRRMVLRSQAEQRHRSPLTKEMVTRGSDSALGTSPGDEVDAKDGVE